MRGPELVALVLLAACGGPSEREGSFCPEATVVSGGRYVPDGTGPAGTPGFWLASGEGRTLEFDRPRDTLTVRYVRGGQEVVEIWRVSGRSP